MEKKMSISRVSSEDINDLFEIEFDSKVCPYTNISSFDVNAERDIASSKVAVKVVIYGTAGAPTIDEVKHDGKFKEMDQITICRSDIGELVFRLAIAETLFLNSNDYVITYIADGDK